MGLTSFFRKNISYEAQKKVNESSGTDIDTSFNKPTTRDNLSSIFKGMTSGVYVASALRNGTIPYWRGYDITYPFVSINGYSTHSALSTGEDMKRGFMKHFFARLSEDPTVNSAMYSVSQHAFPLNSYIFYPDVAISNIGSGNLSRSRSIFFPNMSTNAVQNKLGPYAVQQCLNIDENGNLFVDANRSPSTVFYPIKNSAKYAAFGLSKITTNDILTIISNIAHKESVDNKKVIIDMFTEAFQSFLSIHANNGGVGIDNSFNKDAGNFFKFFKEINSKLTDEVLAYYAENKPEALIQSLISWIKRNDELTICEKLIKKYYFPTPFENTYCMRFISDIPEKNGVSSEDVFRDYEIYKKCIDNANEETINAITGKNVSNNNSNSDVSAARSEMALNGILDARDMKSALLNVCRIVSSGNDSRGIFCFTVRDDSSVAMKEFNTKITKHEAIKRIFIRIFNSASKLNNGEDKEFLEGTTDKFITTPFKLDYSEFFKRFKNQLDANAKKVFDCYRISGYMVTYHYDPYAEQNVTPDGGDLVQQLYDSYKAVSEQIIEPTSFSLVYFKDEDFISSGYDSPSVKLSDMGEQNVPQSLRVDRYGVTKDRIESQIMYSNQRVNLINPWNKELTKPIPKRRSIDKRYKL